MRRFVPLLIAGAALIAAACSDPIAPTRSGPVANLVAGPSTIASVTSSDVNGKTFTFTIDPSGGNVQVGGFRLKYDANSVCNPASSGYGPEYWLKPCQTLTAPITMTARMWVSDGAVYADFSPNIRFSPSSQVILAVKRSAIMEMTGGDATSFFPMYYFKIVSGSMVTVDEAANDIELQTKADNSHGWVWRRIRHFTGYYVRSGFSCDETVGDCGWGDSSLQ